MEEEKSPLSLSHESVTESAEEVWYSVCYEYFSNGTHKAALEWFHHIDHANNCSNNDNNSGDIIKSKDQSEVKPINISADQIDFYKKCGIFAFQSSDHWYKHDKIKNRARTDAHLAMSQARVNGLIAYARKQISDHEKEKPSNVRIMDDLNVFFSLAGVIASPIVWTLLDNICLWISSQLKWNVVFEMTVMDPALFTEMPQNYMQPLLRIMCSLGELGLNDTSFDENAGDIMESSNISTNGFSLTWSFRRNLSDAFLQRVKRKIKSFRPPHRLECTQSHSITFTQTDIARTNINGSSEISFCFLL